MWGFGAEGGREWECVWGGEGKGTEQAGLVGGWMVGQNNEEDKKGLRMGVTTIEATECAVRLCTTLLPACVRACVP